MHIVLDGVLRRPDDALAIEEDAPVTATILDDAGRPRAVETVEPGELAAFVAQRERERPRWVWSTAADWYPVLLASGVRIERSHDLRLVAAILDREWDGADPVAEHRAQLERIDRAPERRRLELLVAAESAGALIAVELRHAGLPWSAEEHDRLLTELLGPRPATGRPAALERLHREIEAALDGASVNPDSPQDLLRALRAAGLRVDSTRACALKSIDHPVIPPLLEYRALARLAAAHGWAWLEAWVRDGRFHPEFVPAGVVTGRWASVGGGALQLPHQVRSAVRADPGWVLVVADAAQLEPRILAAMAGDAAMLAAGADGDLYAGLVAAGIAADRRQAKVAMLGALYGATTGDSGRLMPRLAKAYPRAIGLVEAAARDGERGRRVRTWLGRASPPAGAAGSPQQARARGRFTRNFVVQGTAAEWALCWLGGIRGRLTAAFPGRWPSAVPHLAFFLHDEVLVHTPEAHAERVAAILVDAADDAGRLLFGSPPGTFPISIGVARDYAAAKP